MRAWFYVGEKIEDYSNFWEWFKALLLNFKAVFRPVRVKVVDGSTNLFANKLTTIIPEIQDLDSTMSNKLIVT
jgi:hypothetical protein